MSHPDSPRAADPKQAGPALLRERLPSAAADIRARLETDPAMRARMLQARMLSGGLEDWNSRRRADAREKIVALGKAALPALLAALEDPSDHVRWQAAKALNELHEPETAPDLVRAMEDDDFGVRWLAAGGLAGMGTDCLDALLRGLMADFPSPRMREIGLHVLALLVDDGHDDETIEALIRSLRPGEPAAEAGWAAEKAWEHLRTGGRTK
jgi:hypothetical protein